METMMPHGHCILWDMPLLLTMVISNALIFIAYFTIPYNLIKLGYVGMARQHINENIVIILLFSAFIILCGLTHLSDIITMWLPMWYMDAGIRVACAIISIFTAWLLPAFIKKELARPTEGDINKLLEEIRLLQEKLNEIKNG